MQMPVLAVFFVLREVEAALVLRRSVTVNADSLVVCVWLPASKADPRYTCERKWGCVCSDAAGPALLCPCHATLEQLGLLSSVLGPPPEDGLDSLPLFPAPTGGAGSKERVVEMTVDAAD